MAVIRVIQGHGTKSLHLSMEWVPNYLKHSVFILNRITDKALDETDQKPFQVIFEKTSTVM